jgi:hypothetical protein
MKKHLIVYCHLFREATVKAVTLLIMVIGTQQIDLIRVKKIKIEAAIQC